MHVKFEEKNFFNYLLYVKNFNILIYINTDKILDKYDRDIRSIRN